jgi:hypothetical protein
MAESRSGSVALLKTHSEARFANCEFVFLGQSMTAPSATADDFFLQRIGDILVRIRTDRQGRFDIGEEFRHPMMHPAISRQQTDPNLGFLKFSG